MDAKNVVFVINIPATVPKNVLQRRGTISCEPTIEKSKTEPSERPENIITEAVIAIKPHLQDLLRSIVQSDIFFMPDDTPPTRYQVTFCCRGQEQSHKVIQALKEFGVGVLFGRFHVIPAIHSFETQGLKQDQAHVDPEQLKPGSDQDRTLGYVPLTDICC